MYDLIYFKQQVTQKTNQVDGKLVWSYPTQDQRYGKVRSFKNREKIKYTVVQ